MNDKVDLCGRLATTNMKSIEIWREKNSLSFNSWVELKRQLCIIATMQNAKRLFRRY